MDKSNVMVRFSLYGDDFNPALITKQLKIEPSETYIKGEQIRDGKIKRKETSWSISTKYEISLDINDQINKIMTLLYGKEAIITDLKKKYDLNILFMIVVNIENNDKPAMYFRKSFIHFLSDIDAEVGFDLYVYS